MNENVLKLLGEGYKQSSKVDDAVNTAEKVLALPVERDAHRIRHHGSGASLTPRPRAARPRRPGASRSAEATSPITFEFLTPPASVVAARTRRSRRCKAGATQDVKADGQGAAIAA